MWVKQVLYCLLTYNISTVEYPGDRASLWIEKLCNNKATFYTIPDSFPRSGAKKHLVRYGMYNFQKLSETTSLRCNNSSENSVPKKYG